MFDYLLFAVLLLWYKDPAYLGKFLNSVSWIVGILYAKSKTSSLYFKIQDFLLNVPISPKNNKETPIYILSEGQLKLVTYKDINNVSGEKYYIRVNTKNKLEKVLVFADKNTLVNQYNDLTQKIERSLDNFSKIMEATKGGVDVLPILTRYINGNDNFFNITGYKITYGDIYDFDTNKFLLESNDSLDLIDMNVSEYHFNTNDIINLQ